MVLFKSNEIETIWNFCKTCFKYSRWKINKFIRVFSILKGLNDYLYDLQREQRQMLNISGQKHLDESDGEDSFSTNSKPNNYFLVSYSQKSECYIIKREFYLKHMLGFTNDKSRINSYLDELVLFYFKAMYFYWVLVSCYLF